MAQTDQRRRVNGYLGDNRVQGKGLEAVATGGRNTNAIDGGFFRRRPTRFPDGASQPNVIQKRSLELIVNIRLMLT